MSCHLCSSSLLLLRTRRSSDLLSTTRAVLPQADRCDTCPSSSVFRAQTPPPSSPRAAAPHPLDPRTGRRFLLAPPAHLSDVPPFIGSTGSCLVHQTTRRIMHAWCKGPEQLKGAGRLSRPKSPVPLPGGCHMRTDVPRECIPVFECRPEPSESL